MACQNLSNGFLTGSSTPVAWKEVGLKRIESPPLYHETKVQVAAQDAASANKKAGYLALIVINFCLF
jgi:hypothetical protein